jgi:hypothetical protein
MASPKGLLKAEAAEAIALADAIGCDGWIDPRTFRTLLAISSAAFERWLRIGRIPQPDLNTGQGGIRRWRLSVVRAFLAGEKTAA